MIFSRVLHVFRISEMWKGQPGARIHEKRSFGIVFILRLPSLAIILYPEMDSAVIFVMESKFVCAWCPLVGHDVGRKPRYCRCDCAESRTHTQRQKAGRMYGLNNRGDGQSPLTM